MKIQVTPGVQVAALTADRACAARGWVQSVSQPARRDRSITRTAPLTQRRFSAVCESGNTLPVALTARSPCPTTGTQRLRAGQWPSLESARRRSSRQRINTSFSGVPAHVGPRRLASRSDGIPMTAHRSVTIWSLTRVRRYAIALASTRTVLFALHRSSIVGAVFMVARTAFGRDYVRRLVISLVRQRRDHGSINAHPVITGGFLTGYDDPDSLAIREVGTIRSSYWYWPRDVALRHSRLARPAYSPARRARRTSASVPPAVRKRHLELPDDLPPRQKRCQPRPGGSFGDYVVIDSAVVRNAIFLLTLPWHPSPTLHGAARDSALRFELKRKDHEIRRTREGLARTWRWTGANVRRSLHEPRERSGPGIDRLFVVNDASVNEADPPFLFRNARATLRQRGDSIWIDVPHWDLPGSTGSGHAKIWWGGKDLPVRYAIHAIGDSVSMRDIAWVYPTLPQTGSGRTILDIGTEPKHLRLTDYVLTNLDAHSTRSHLTGRMTFTLGEDTLIVKDVQLAASPVNFDLLRTLNGKPFPYNWQGDITGTVRASGGNLGRFKVEDAKFVFADANVPGAITRGSAKGELNIFEPAFTAFHGLAVNVETLDLRTLQFLNKEFPRLHGTVSGTAVLDSSWLDVRFHDADMLHHDGDAPVSHVTGSGRVTWGDKYLTYDLDLLAHSISFTTLRQSYPAIPLHGQFSGPIRVLGQSPDLHLETALTSETEDGTLTYNGQVDADPPVYGARGTGTVTNADLRAWLDRPNLPKTVVNGAYTLDLSGDTLPHLAGLASITLAPSTLGDVRVDSSYARVHFDSGLVNVDTLALQTSAGQLGAHGTVALVDNRPGSLLYTLSLNSFADANQLFGHLITTPITGAGTLAGTLSGTPSLLALTGKTRARARSVQQPAQSSPGSIHAASAASSGGGHQRLDF